MSQVGKKKKSFLADTVQCILIFEYTSKQLVILNKYDDTQMSLPFAKTIL